MGTPCIWSLRACSWTRTDRSLSSAPAKPESGRRVRQLRSWAIRPSSAPGRPTAATIRSASLSVALSGGGSGADRKADRPSRRSRRGVCTSSSPLDWAAGPPCWPKVEKRAQPPMSWRGAFRERHRNLTLAPWPSFRHDMQKRLPRSLPHATIRASARSQ